MLGLVRRWMPCASQAWASRDKLELELELVRNSRKEWNWIRPERLNGVIREAVKKKMRAIGNDCG